MKQKINFLKKVSRVSEYCILFHMKQVYSKNVAKHNDIGRIGEDISAKFLERKGLTILERNYWKPYGEIDIVARETGMTHFVEVKSVSCEIEAVGDPIVSHGTGYRPEENVHPQKIRRLKRVIEAYIISHETGHWQFDVVVVYVDKKRLKSKVKWLKDIILN